MTQRDPAIADSSRHDRLTQKFQDRSYRAAYLVQHVKGFLASQIRALRGDMTQEEFGKLIDKPQSVISRLEDEEYGRVSLQTLLDIAVKLDIGLAVRFVNYTTFLDWTNDFSQEAFAPPSFSAQAPQEMPGLASSAIDAASFFTIDPTGGFEPQLARTPGQSRSSTQADRYNALVNELSGCR